MKEFIYYKEETESLSEDYHAAQRTIMISNIPSHLSVENSNKYLHEFFAGRYVSFKSASTLGCYKPLYQYLKERITIVTTLLDEMSKQDNKNQGIFSF